MADTEAIKLLKSIDASLKTLVARVKRPASTEVASDADLDGTHGDPELKFRVRDCEAYKGHRFSECPPEVLDKIAEMLEWLAGQAEAKDEKTSAGKPVAPYKRKDAARARGWAKRMRDGKMKAPKALSGAKGFGDGDEKWGGGDDF